MMTNSSSLESDMSLAICTRRLIKAHHRVAIQSTLNNHSPEVKAFKTHSILYGIIKSFLKLPVTAGIRRNCHRCQFKPREDANVELTSPVAKTLPLCDRDNPCDGDNLSDAERCRDRTGGPAYISCRQ